MHLIFAPKQLPANIQYKSFCEASTELPAWPVELIVPLQMQGRPRDRFSVRKMLSGLVRTKLREWGVSHAVKMLKAKILSRWISERAGHIKPSDNKSAWGYAAEEVRGFVSLLMQFQPAAKCLGFQKEPRQEINQHVLILWQAKFAEQYRSLLVAGWQPENLLVMPVPESDYWAYWRHRQFLRATPQGEVDVVEILGHPDFLNDLIKKRVLESRYGSVAFRTRRFTNAYGLENSLQVYPFPSFSSELIQQNMQKIQQVKAAFSDAHSQNIYEMVLFGSPAKRFAYFFQNMAANLQYFEHFRLNPGDVVVNVGVASGFEIPFFCGMMQGKGQVHCLDPFGFDFLSRYVRESIPQFQDMVFEQRAVVCDVTSAIAPKSEVCDLGNAPATTIDDFVTQQNLSRVDLIKMDIEAMEELAVPKMVETIKKFRPQLAIAIYHKPQHYWELPLFLMQHCQDYRFYFNIYSLSHFEGVFFAIPKERLA